MLHLSYYPLTWKFIKIILILKLNKPPENITSYPLISLLPSLKMYYKRLLPFATVSRIISNTQFSFKQGHSTIHQLQSSRHNSNDKKSSPCTLLSPLKFLSSQFVKTNLSRYFNIKTGVPQSSNISFFLVQCLYS